jgi:hypothetical protein
MQQPVSPEFGQAGDARPVPPRAALGLFLALAAGWVPVLVDGGAVARAANLFPLAEQPHPYFMPGHAIGLYFWTPLVAASATLLLLTPGLLLTLALNGGRTVGHWLAGGLALSLLLVSATATGVQVALGGPLRGGAFAASVVACSAACLAVLLLRARGGRVCHWPLRQPHAAAQLASAVLVPGLLLIALTPKVYWENFTGDGAHAFESGRLLLHQASPFWSPSAGEIASFPGANTVLFCYPTSWFIRLFGEVEAAARLPYFLYLPALYGALLALIGVGRARPMGLAETWLTWVPLILFTVVMAFSATYSPYSADLALPGAEYSLLMACFFGSVLASLGTQRGWTALFTFLTLLVAPNGLQLVGLWVLAQVVLDRPRPWRDILTSVGSVAGTMLVLAVAVRLLGALGLPAPGQEHSFTNLLRRCAFLRFDDWNRFAYVVVPGGIVPALALFAWPWLDGTARRLALVTALYFAFFYVQAYGALHYFAPAMLLPVVVFWRSRFVTSDRLRRPALLGVCLAGGIALALSLPRYPALYTAGRAVGSAVEDRTRGYEVAAAPALKRSELLRKLFPDDAQPEVPGRSYGDSPLVWNYYAHHRPEGTRAVHYVLQKATDPTPPGSRLLAEREGTVLCVQDDSAWARDRALRPATPAGSRIYQVPRPALFRGYSWEYDRQVTRVEDVLARLGMDSARLRAWLFPAASTTTPTDSGTPADRK